MKKTEINTLTDRQKAILDLIKSVNQFQIQHLVEKAEIEDLITNGYVKVEYKVTDNTPDLNSLPDIISKHYLECKTIIKFDILESSNPNITPDEIVIYFKDGDKTSWDTWRFINNTWALQPVPKPKNIFHKLPKTIKYYYAYSNFDIHTVEDKVNQITVYLTNGTHDIWKILNNSWIRMD